MEFEELRLRRQLEIQQDIELRRRLMEEQHHQLISELEYRQQLQQLQHIQAQQSQQNGINQLLAQQQQQQQNIGREQAFLSSFQDDFMMQRQQLMMQDQMQQRLRAASELAHQSQHHLPHDQYDATAEQQMMAMLNAARNNNHGDFIDEVALCRELEQRQLLQMLLPQAAAPPAPPSPPHPSYMPPSNSVRPRSNSIPLDQEVEAADQPNYDPREKEKRGKSESEDVPPASAKPSKKSSKASQSKVSSQPPPSVTSPVQGCEVHERAPALCETEGKEVNLDGYDVHDSEVPEKKHKKVKSFDEKKLSGKKEKHTPKDKTKSGKLDGRTKEARALKAAAFIRQHKTDGLSDHEKSLINFLGLRGTEEQSMDGGKTATSKLKDCSNDEAANIVVNFKHVDVSYSDERRVKAWGRHKEIIILYPEMSSSEFPFLTPELRFNLPSLPIEPMDNPNISDVNSMIGTDKNAQVRGARDTSYTVADGCGEIKIISQTETIYASKKKKKTDCWWPTDDLIRRERHKRGYASDEEDTDDEVTNGSQKGDINFVKSTVVAAKKRLKTSVEPAVLEKLPHCKLYENFCARKAVSDDVTEPPKFCCQVTETFPHEAMLCCSECSSWRHAQCGGHYKRYSTVDPSEGVFKPVCDRCFLEKDIMDEHPSAAKRIDRQRIEHLRRCNATNAVVRQAAFAKHSGQYKWPLGSVSGTHIAGHTKSVQTRHEKAEKQWADMSARIGSGNDSKTRERIRVRTRELEKLVVNVEDAGKIYS